MERKEWLENFIRLVDTGANTLEYRRHCRIKAQHLPRYLAQLASFRKELARLTEEEESAKRLEQRASSLEKARAERAQKRLEVAKWTHGVEEVETNEGTADSGDSGSDTQAVGPRDDSGDEPDVHD